MKIFIILTVFSVSLVLTNPVSNEEEEQAINENHSHPYGGPINLMRFDENENVIIDEEALERTFSHPLVKDRKVVAISIIGAFRKGKSFLMDYALRYMYANYRSVAYQDNPLANKHDWIGDPDEPLKGFSWRGGASRDTTGVVLWSDVFLHEQQNSKTKQIEKLAIILMDTQGLFDTKTSPTDNSRIFALGTLISSVQIFNLNDVIQENQLEYLHMATDFAKFAMKQHKKYSKGARNYKPFQTLIFLMRDWQNVGDFEYGQGGGGQYLQHVLNIDPKQPKTLQDVRRYITESFDQRSCFLLPHPGFEAVNNNNYDGRFSALSEDFQINLKDFLNSLLQPKNLKKKKVLNNEVTGAEYLEYLKVYFEAFQSDEIPKIDTLHRITVRKQYDIVMQEALAEYKKLLEQSKIETKIDDQWKERSVIDEEMNQIHQDAQQKAIKIFKDKKKLGGEEDERKYETELRTQIETNRDYWKNKHFDKYQHMKALDEENKKTLEETKKKNEEIIRMEQEKAEQERIKLEEIHRNRTEILEGTIHHVRNQTAQEINALQGQFNRTRMEAEKQKQLMLDQLEREKLAIAKKAEEAENAFKNQLNLMQEDIKKKEELVRKEIETKKEEKLEMLRLQAEERKMEYDRQMQIEEKRAQAIAEQRKFEHEQLKEERRIREAAVQEERRERERAQREQIAADRAFQLRIAEAKIQAEKEERAAKAEKERQFQEMISRMNTPAPSKEGFNLWSCIGSLLSSC